MDSGLLSRSCRKRRPSSYDDGGVSWVFSSCGASVGFLTRHSAFFIVQLSSTYVTTRKTIALTRPTFVGKIMSLLFNTVHIGHSFSSEEQASFNFMAAVTICSDFGALKNKVYSVSIVPPSICHEVMGPDAMILVF